MTSRTMVFIPTCFTCVELIQLSPLLHTLLTTHKTIIVFCSDDDYFVSQYLFVYTKGIVLKPYSELHKMTSEDEFFHINIEDAKKINCTQGLFIGHMGIGDMINLQGAVNYLSLTLDEIFVTCHDSLKHIAVELYESNPKVRLLVTKVAEDICYEGRTLPGNEIQWTPTFRKLIQYFKIQHICGVFLPNSIM